MIEYLPAFLLAMAVLIVPASARYGGKKIIAKLDESRARDEDNANNLAASLAMHRADLMREVLAIKEQTTNTNGKVANLTERMIREEAKTEMLTEMMLGRQPDKGA